MIGQYTMECTSIDSSIFTKGKAHAIHNDVLTDQSTMEYVHIMTGRYMVYWTIYYEMHTYWPINILRNAHVLTGLYTTEMHKVWPIVTIV